MINDLGLNTEEYCQNIILKNGIKAHRYNQEAYDIIVQFIKNKNIQTSQNELALTNQNIDLKKQSQKLQNTIAMLESQHTKELAQKQEEWHQKEVQLLESNGKLLQQANEKDKQMYEQQAKLKSMSIFQFIKWRRKGID